MVVILLVFYIIISQFPSTLAWSEDSCKSIYFFSQDTQITCILGFQEDELHDSITEQREEEESMGKTAPECEALSDDIIFSQYCYFKKAVETMDGLYCYNSSNSERCLEFLAAETGDSKYCDLYYPKLKDNCLKFANNPSGYKVFLFPLSCEHFSEKDRKQKCETLFGEFYEEVNSRDELKTTKKVKFN